MGSGLQKKCNKGFLIITPKLLLKTMSRLIKYAKKSKLSIVKILVGKEMVKFNLHEELRVDEDIINDEVVGNTQIFAYLNMVYNELNKRNKLLELRNDKYKSLLYSRFLKDKNPTTGRPYSKEYIGLEMNKDIKYIRYVQEIIEAEKQLDDVKSCIESFKQRKDLIQTVSANRRAESKQ